MKEKTWAIITLLLFSEISAQMFLFSYVVFVSPLGTVLIVGTSNFLPALQTLFCVLYTHSTNVCPHKAIRLRLIIVFLPLDGGL